MDTSTDIVFIHRNYSWYLPYVIHQVKKSNPQSRVALIAQSAEVPGTINVSLDRYRNAALPSEFARRYVHMHHGNPVYESFCFQRWFILLDYMTTNGVDSALYLDSDVLLYSPLSDISLAYGGETIECGYSIPNQSYESHEWHASGHASYWTKPALESLCDFLLESFTAEKYLAVYREKWEWQQRSGVRGGVSDMTGLYLFYLERPELVTNFAAAASGTVIDHNLNIALNFNENEYELEDGKKRVQFYSDVPMLFRHTDGGAVRAHALHLQGGTKNEIPRYYRGRPFPAKPLYDGYALMRRAGQKGKRLVGR